MDGHISVVPNLTGRPSTRPELGRRLDAGSNRMDPDVRHVLETGGDDFDVHKMPHNKTKEESASESSQNKSGTSSWIIMAMAVIVVILIIGIIYLVLKYNEPVEQPGILLDALRPSPHILKRSVPSERPAGPSGQNARPPGPRVSTEEPSANKGRGDKEEMLSILKRSKAPPALPTIPESAKVEETSTADDQMVDTFYKQMESRKSDSDELPNQNRDEVRLLVDDND